MTKARYQSFRVSGVRRSDGRVFLMEDNCSSLEHARGQAIFYRRSQNSRWKEIRILNNQGRILQRV